MRGKGMTVAVDLNAIIFFSRVSSLAELERSLFELNLTMKTSSRISTATNEADKYPHGSKDVDREYKSHHDTSFALPALYT
jgi:hypothetical protein